MRLDGFQKFGFTSGEAPHRTFARAYQGSLRVRYFDEAKICRRVDVRYSMWWQLLGSIPSVMRLLAQRKRQRVDMTRWRFGRLEALRGRFSARSP